MRGNPLAELSISSDAPVPRFPSFQFLAPSDCLSHPSRARPSTVPAIQIETLLILNTSSPLSHSSHFPAVERFPSVKTGKPDCQRFSHGFGWQSRASSFTVRECKFETNTQRESHEYLFPPFQCTGEELVDAADKSRRKQED